MKPIQSYIAFVFTTPFLCPNIVSMPHTSGPRQIQYFPPQQTTNKDCTFQSTLDYCSYPPFARKAPRRIWLLPPEHNASFVLIPNKCAVDKPASSQSAREIEKNKTNIKWNNRFRCDKSNQFNLLEQRASCRVGRSAPLSLPPSRR